MKRVGGIVATILFASTLPAADPHVAVPDTTWSEILPYLESTLRIDRDGDSVIVAVSSHRNATKSFEPYDEALGEFATVLLVQGMGERRIQKVIDRVTKEIEAGDFDMARSTPRELASAYWTKLTADERFTRHLRELFAKAQADGRIACLICEDGFEPRHLDVR